MKTRIKINASKGLTLIELTIVLAIIAIIAAILIPTFLTATDRARLRSDVQSARVIQNAIDLYRAERGRNVEGTTVYTIIQNLSAAGLLDNIDARAQSQGATWTQIQGLGVVVDITASPDGVHRAYNNLSDSERRLVRRSAAGG